MKQSLEAPRSNQPSEEEIDDIQNKRLDDEQKILTSIREGTEENMEKIGKGHLTKREKNIDKNTKEIAITGMIKGHSVVLKYKEEYEVDDKYSVRRSVIEGTLGGVGLPEEKARELIEYIDKESIAHDVSLEDEIYEKNKKARDEEILQNALKDILG